MPTPTQKDVRKHRHLCKLIPYLQPFRDTFAPHVRPPCHIDTNPTATSCSSLKCSYKESI